jgi:hypothetical protein
MKTHPCEIWERWKATPAWGVTGECPACGGVRLYSVVGRSKFCTPECRDWFQVNHVREHAVPEARRVDGDRCRICRRTAYQVNHKYPSSLFKNGRSTSCSYHQSNLETLCDDCHIEVTIEQHKAGLVRYGAISMAIASKKNGKWTGGNGEDHQMPLFSIPSNLKQ